MGDETNLHAMAAKEGSPEGFCGLYERVSPALNAWCRLRTAGSLGRHLQSEDLFQEIWWRALSAFPRYEPAKGPFRPWVFSIAHNVCSEALRSRPEQRMASSTPGAGVGPLDDEMQAALTSITAACRRNENVSLLLDHIKALPREERQLFQLRGLEGLSFRDAGEVLGLSEEAAKKRWQRMRGQLRSMAAWSDLVEET